MHDEIEEQIGAERAAEIGPEINAIFSFAVGALDLYYDEHRSFTEQMREREGTPTLIDEETGDVAYGEKGGPEDSDWYTDANGYYALGLYDMGIVCFLGCWGKHSATQLLHWNNAWFQVHNNCNHGRCANHSDMRVKCYLQYYDTVDSDYYVTGRMFQNSCNTRYDEWSNSDHNCHDDSRKQMWEKVNGRALSDYSYWCGDGDSSTDISGGFERGGSPECAANTSRGYIHPWM